ncbi:MAG: hypothetical protein Q4E28_02060 [Clostridia bacterium]|nr:hypothetical protein [Clostridia bacterium]
MTAFESNNRYVGDVRECSNYAVRTLKKTIKENSEMILNRAPASKNEIAFSEILKKESDAFSDQVIDKTYTARLNRKRYSNFFNGFLLLVMTVLIFLSHALLPILSIPSILIWALVLLFFFGIFSISKKKNAKNIMVIKRPTENIEKNIILTANMDAPTSKIFNGAFNALLKIISLILILLSVLYPALSLLEKYDLMSFTFNSVLFLYVSGISSALAALICFIYGFGFNDSKSTPGIANNLTGCFSILGVLRYLKTQDLNFKHTQICVLFAGSKYPANAGTRQFIKENIDFYGPGKTEVICLDTLEGKNNFNVKGKLASKLKKSAKASHIDLKSTSSAYQHTQARPFDSANYMTGVLTSLHNSKPDFYETHEDSGKNIDVNPIEYSIKTVLEHIYSIENPIENPKVESKERTEIKIQTPDGEQTEIIEKTVLKDEK